MQQEPLQEASSGKGGPGGPPKAMMLELREGEGLWEEHSRDRIPAHSKQNR